MAEGHRGRVRQKVIENGFKGFFPHEILEYLLYPFVVRKDTNPIAHEMIARYGSLSGVLAAGYDELRLIPNVSETAALFISKFTELCDAVSDAATKEARYLKTFADCERAAVRNHRQMDLEECYLLCIDDNYRILINGRLQKGSAHNIAVDIKKLTRLVVNSKCTKVIFTHNHTKGDSNPSVADIKFTDTLYRLLHTLGVELIDHIVVSAESRPFSFNSEGLMAKIKERAEEKGSTR